MKNQEQPTPEELEALLQRLGVPSGEWQATEGKPTLPPFVKNQIETLAKLRDYLSGIVTTDAQSVARMKEQIVRMQRGGGI